MKLINIVQFPKGNMHSAACYDSRNNTKYNIKKINDFRHPFIDLHILIMIVLVRTDTDIDEMRDYPTFHYYTN